MQACESEQSFSSPRISVSRFKAECFQKSYEGSPVSSDRVRLWKLLSNECLQNDAALQSTTVTGRNSSIDANTDIHTFIFHPAHPSGKGREADLGGLQYLAIFENLWYFFKLHTQTRTSQFEGAINSRDTWSVSPFLWVQPTRLWITNLSRGIQVTWPNHRSCHGRSKNF